MSSASIISVKFHLGYFVFFVRLPYPPTKPTRRMRNLEQQQSTNCTAANRKFSLRDTQLFLFIYSSVQFSFVKGAHEEGNGRECRGNVKCVYPCHISRQHLRFFYHFFVVVVVCLLLRIAGTNHSSC